MKNLNRLALFILLFGIALDSGAQETLSDLTYSLPQSSTAKEVSKNTGRINLVKHPFIYVIDTLSLPFFDDFTRDKVKKYEAKKNDNNVSLKINYDFSVNGQTPKTLEYQTEPTFSILRTLSGDIIESENPTLFINLYVEGKVVARDTGWTNLITEFDQSSGVVTYDTLLAERTLINTPDTFYRVADDFTLWTPAIDSFDSARAAPLINNTFAKNPITQGVATFDGTNRLGNPYDQTSETTYGICDMLLSKPVYLDSNMEDVYLSFFYQAGGNGNLPEEEDSLVLEFFDLADSTWRFAWKAEGPEEEDSLFSDQVFLKIDGRKYLQTGFRFRFKNYGTQSGSLDHWHIDYVRLDKNRDTIADDSTLNDVAFISGITSFLDPYTSVPYYHYNSDPGFFDASSVSVVNSNLSALNLVLGGLRYEIFDESGSLILSEITVDPNISPRTVRKTNYPISISPIFPDLGTKYAEFPYLSRFTSTGVGNNFNINDTIHGSQYFGDYYAYDDGSAEKAYALTGAGVRLACEFNSPTEDSLKGFLFNFPRMLHNDNEDLTIELLIWTDLFDDPIYTAELSVEPLYTNANEFIRIPLDQPVNVEGQFYIGYRQIEATKIYIGFDVNTNNAQKLNYQIGETWYTSSFGGSLMLRPDFGDGQLLGTREQTARKESFTVYPNPAHNEVTINFDASRVKSINVYDISGRLFNIARIERNKLNVSDLSNGAYFIQVITTDNRSFTQKLIVSH